MNDHSYSIVGRWWDDDQTPALIGARFLDMLDRLAPLSPVMKNWLFSDPVTAKAIPMADARPKMTALVERGAEKGPNAVGLRPGYYVFTRGGEVESEFGRPRSVDVSVEAGSGEANQVRFKGGSYANQLQDPAVTTYPIYKGALEVLASAWPCPWMEAYLFVPNLPPLIPFAMPDDTWRPSERETYIFPWIVYFSAALAHDLAPPADLVCERTPGGGLILSATMERLDADNPDHMRRTKILQAIVADRTGKYVPSPWGKGYPPPRVGPY